MELTRKLGVKFADVMDFKMTTKRDEDQRMKNKETKLKYNRKRISLIRKQISKSIKDQKMQVIRNNK